MKLLFELKYQEVCVFAAGAVIETAIDMVLRLCLIHKKFKHEVITYSIPKINRKTGEEKLTSAIGIKITLK